METTLHEVDARTASIETVLNEFEHDISGMKMRFWPDSYNDAWFYSQWDCSMSGQDNSGREPVNARIFPVPPVVAGLFIAAGLALNSFVPLLHPAPTPLESRIVGGVIAACAFVIVILAWREMRRLRTTFHPGGKATALVRSGIYTRTRNPMYLGLTLFTLALGIGTANPWLVLLAPLLLLYLQERVVKREEAYLTARFGAEYEAYRRRVRRWF